MVLNTIPIVDCGRPAPNPLTHQSCRLGRGHERECLHWEYTLDGCVVQPTCGTCRFDIMGQCTNASSRAFGEATSNLVTCSMHERERHLANPQPRRRMINRGVITFLGMGPPSQMVLLRHAAFMYLDDCGCRNADGDSTDHNSHHRAALLREVGALRDDGKEGFH